MSANSLPPPDQLARLAEPPGRSVSAAVMVADDGRYLFQLRDDFPGLHVRGHWALFGGSIQPGETPEQAMRRELQEELTWTPWDVLPLLVSVHALYPSLWVARMHFFAVPFRLAEVDGMVQTEGAGKGLFTVEEACQFPLIAPWDLAAVMMHSRMKTLFPEHG